ncbi:MAG TPA: hypothetical protein ENJ18_09565 [Nannocystis exedens]|nr:hypothetical protein [Nannocystis exedens]
MTTRLIFVSIATSALLIGCAGPVGSEDDARSGWNQTDASLKQGGNSAQSAGAPAPSGENPVFRAIVASSVDYDYNCKDSGVINYKGNYYVDTENVGVADVDFDFQATFKGCTNGDLTIDGEIDYALEVESSDTANRVSYSYEGDLVWSGSVEGTCAVSMSALVETGIDGISVDYKGSLCGFDAAATLSVSG